MISTKIQLKTDTIANWTLNENALLLNGEAAVVLFPNGSTKIKIGDGTTTFKNLPYIDNDLSIKISEDCGLSYSKLNELLLINISADEYHKLVKSGDVLSNAIYEVVYENEDCFGERLINVGSPIDDSDAATKNYVDSEISKIDVSESLNSKSAVKLNDANLNISNQNIDLIVSKVSFNEYKTILKTHTLLELSNYIFDISCDLMDAFGRLIKNVADPIDDNDAVNKKYLDEILNELGDIIDEINGEN